MHSSFQLTSNSLEAPFFPVGIYLDKKLLLTFCLANICSSFRYLGTIATASFHRSKVVTSFHTG